MLQKQQLLKATWQDLARAIGSALVAAVLIWFASGRIEQMADSLEKGQRLQYALERRSDTVTTLQRDFQLIGSGDEKITQAFPSEENVLQFIGALESVANGIGLKQSLRFGAPVLYADDPFPVESLDYTVQLDGNVFTLLRYLEQFQNLPVLTGINAMNLTSQTSRGWTESMVVNLQARVFIRPTQ